MGDWIKGSEFVEFDSWSPWTSEDEAHRQRQKIRELKNQILNSEVRELLEEAERQLRFGNSYRTGRILQEISELHR